MPDKAVSCSPSSTGARAPLRHTSHTTPPVATYFGHEGGTLSSQTVLIFGFEVLHPALLGSRQFQVMPDNKARFWLPAPGRSHSTHHELFLTKGLWSGLGSISIVSKVYSSMSRIFLRLPAIDHKLSVWSPTEFQFLRGCDPGTQHADRG